MKKLFLITFLFAPFLVQSQERQSLEVLFAFDRHELLPESVKLLDEFVLMYKSSGTTSLIISGHTDGIGSNEYNLVLSQKRAETVAAYLKSKGIPEDALKISWQGKLEPVSTNNTDKGRQLNRRVTIYYKLAEPFAEVTETECQDLVFTIEQGAQVIVDCECLKKIPALQNIKPVINEYYTSSDMRRNNIQTVDVNSNCLISGGMIEMNVPGLNFPEDFDEECFTIRVPVPEFDKDMQLYEAQDHGNTIVWKPIEENLRLYEDENGRQYYEFRRQRPNFNINIDKPMIGNPVLAVQGLFRQPLSVKTRLGVLNEAFLTNSDDNMLLDTRFRTSKKRRIINCFSPDMLVLANIYDDGQGHELKVPLSELKFSRWRNIYIIRKSDFEKFITYEARN